MVRNVARMRLPQPIPRKNCLVTVRASTVFAATISGALFEWRESDVYKGERCYTRTDHDRTQTPRFILENLSKNFETHEHSQYRLAKDISVPARRIMRLSRGSPH